MIRGKNRFSVCHVHVNTFISLSVNFERFLVQYFNEQFQFHFFRPADFIYFSNSIFKHKYESISSIELNGFQLIIFRFVRVNFLLVSQWNEQITVKLFLICVCECDVM